MNLRLPSERKSFILGILLGILLSGVTVTIYSSLVSHDNNQLGRLETGKQIIETVSINCPGLRDNSISEKIDLNHSPLEELDKLPGIGEAKADSIIEFRQKYGNFKSIDEILYVKGISETVFRQFCHLIEVKNP